MSDVVQIQIPVEPETARLLGDQRRLEAVGRLIDLMVRPGEDDPLAALLEAISRRAREAGLTEADVEDELNAYNTERRGG